MGIKTEYVPVAQLDRVTDSDSVGRTFESCQARHKNPRKQDVFGGFAMLAKAIFYYKIAEFTTICVRKEVSHASRNALEAEGKKPFTTFLLQFQ